MPIWHQTTSVSLIGLSRAHCCDTVVRGRRLGRFPGLNGAPERLANSWLAGTCVLQHCQLDPADLVASVRELREKVGAVVSALPGTDDIDGQLRAEKLVLQMSKEQLLRDRSLVKPQGWEPEPAALPDIETLLAKTTAVA